MADKLEDLLKNAVQGKTYGGKSEPIKEAIRLDKPMILKHSLDGDLDNNGNIGYRKQK